MVPAYVLAYNLQHNRAKWWQTNELFQKTDEGPTTQNITNIQPIFYVTPPKYYKPVNMFQLQETQKAFNLEY